MINDEANQMAEKYIGNLSKRQLQLVIKVDHKLTNNTTPSHSFKHRKSSIGRDDKVLPPEPSKNTEDSAVFLLGDVVLDHFEAAISYIPSIIAFCLTRWSNQKSKEILSLLRKLLLSCRDYHRQSRLLSEDDLELLLSEVDEYLAMLDLPIYIRWDEDDNENER
jgi:hypothetical protein